MLTNNFERKVYTWGDYPRTAYLPLLLFHRSCLLSITSDYSVSPKPFRRIIALRSNTIRSNKWGLDSAQTSSAIEFRRSVVGNNPQNRLEKPKTEDVAQNPWKLVFPEIGLIKSQTARRNKVFHGSAYIGRFFFVVAVFPRSAATIFGL